MGGEFDPLGPWERVASELRACRESQQRAWGDLDSALIGRYLAGEVTPEERRRVDLALEQLPQLRELTDLVRDVLTTSEPEAAPPPAPGPEPAILRFSPRPAPRRPWAGVLRRRASIAAAACLLVTLGLAMPRTDALPTASAPDARPGGGVASRDVAFSGLEGTQPAGAFDLEAHPVVEAVAPRTEDVKLARLEVDRSITELKKGDLVGAERNLRQAHAICKRKWGKNHPTTNWTSRHLAEVYQYALSTPAPQEFYALSASADGKDRVGHAGTFANAYRAPPGANPSNPYTVARDLAPAGRQPARAETFAAPMRRARETALALRVRLTRDEPAQVRASVVPVLITALREAKVAKERAGLALALANLGPAAHDAVPALEECLKKSDNERERRALRFALWRVQHPPEKPSPPGRR
jgi:hypothetical protein